MFIEKIKSVVAVVFMLVVTCFVTPAFAGDVVPTPKDVNFAGQFYVIFRNIVDYNELIRDEIVLNKDYDTTISTIKSVMNKRLEYAQKALEDLKTITPTKDFESAYNAVSNGLNDDIGYVKSIIDMCDKKATIEELENKETVLSKTSKVYLDAKDEFVIIIKNWQDTYIKQVEEIYEDAMSKK